MTELAAILTRQIRDSGPITIAEYMMQCLQHPTHGFYVNRDPFGASGDFTTAPEISQMFGELLGLALVQAWLDRGSPSSFNLVELGPGRGTLMSDMLRAAAQVASFVDGADVHLVETSPVLRTLQAKTIARPVTHQERFEDTPAGPLFLVANEFFDALPVRQFIRDGDGWRERVVGLENDTLSFGLTDITHPSYLEFRLEDTHDGDLVEYSSQREVVAGEIGRRICQGGGAALIIDYGDWRSLGDTLQALRKHSIEDALESPGAADVTSHVDFEAIARAAAPARHSKLTPQGTFLERLGITNRAQSLAKGLTDESLTNHVAAHHRLTHPDEMGTLFKVMAIFAPDTPVPPGLGA